jgi:hypothetical protein
MKVTTKSVLKKLPKNLKLTSVLFEAITNSFQAGATDIKINFKSRLLGQNSLLEDTTRIESFIIEDNGQGFTDENIKSFNYYMSDLKEALGCKGMGRFTYLTICEKVKVNSFNNNKNISFDFDRNTDEVVMKTNNEPLIRKTILEFIDIKNDRTISTDLIMEKKEIINHFISTFMFRVKNSKPELTIRLCTDDIEIEVIKSEEYGKDFEEFQFEIKGEKFNIFYKKSGASIKGFYCADERSVEKDGLNITFKTGNGYGLLYFVTSNYFDRNVNDTRNSFSIKEENNGLYDDKIDWKMINQILFMKIDEICTKIGININEKVVKNREASIEAAPYLVAYIKQSINMSTASEIIKEAKDRFSKDKEYIRDKRNMNNEDYSERLYTSTHAELAEYMFDREKIILDIKKDIDNSDKKSNETIIHKKIMPPKTSNNIYESYKDNHLWLFDERFMIYTYAYSDMTINKILGLDDKDKNVRPDICIFTKSKEDIQDIIIIELKGSDATGEKNAAGLNEINKYTKKIKDYFEENSREVRIWSYLITSLSDTAKDDLNNMEGIHKAYTPKGEMFYIYNSKLNATTHIYSLETMVEDAMARNQLFLDILKGRVIK